MHLRKLLLGAMLLSALTAGAAKLFTIGDSTMARYDGSTGLRFGWGELLPAYFDDSVQIEDKAVPGASSKTFYQSYWTAVREQLSPGDFVVIQFAHNDEWDQGMDGDCGTSIATFKTYLQAYIDESKACGAIPVLATPICWNRFGEDGRVSRPGAHVLADTIDYPQAIRQVAATYADVPVVDLTEATQRVWNTLGHDFCTQYLFCPTDDTHTNHMGACVTARAFVEALQQAQAADSVSAADSVLCRLAALAVLPLSREWLLDGVAAHQADGFLGEGYAGSEVQRSYALEAYGLQGRLSLVASEGFYLSADGRDWSDSLAVDCPAGLYAMTVYVRTCLADSDVEGSLCLHDTVAGTSLALSARSMGSQRPENLEVSLSWPFSQGVEGQRMSCSPAGVSACFPADTVEKGSGLIISNTRNWNGVVFSHIQAPSGTASSADAANRICFRVDLAQGYVFVPTAVGLKAGLQYNDNGKLKIIFQAGQRSKTLASSVQPNRYRDGSEVSYTSCQYSLEGFEVKGGETFCLELNLMNLGNNKSVLLGDICVEGRLSAATDHLPDAPFGGEAFDGEMPLWYDLTGRALRLEAGETPRPGLYVSGGRKWLVK